MSDTNDRKSANVPGQALGFSLQFTWMVELLAKSPPGSFVSFEVLDDVAVQHTSGALDLHQTKSALASNPLTDRSPVFWKTLANFAETSRVHNVFQSGGICTLYVSNTVEPGGIATLFNSALTDKEIETAHAFACNALGIADSEPIVVRGLPETLALEVKRFFSYPRDVRYGVIKCFRYRLGSGSPQTDLLELFKFVEPNKKPIVANEAVGWVKRNVDLLLEKQLPAILSGDVFIREMTTFIRKYNEQRILQSIAPPVAPDDVKSELSGYVFVKQLQALNTDFELELEAINDFFRSSIDRTNWADDGIVHRSSFDELDKDLRERWKNQRRLVAAQYSGKDPEEIGKILLFQCLLEKAEIEGINAPTYFTRGCYHTLADECHVGWHPHFSTMFTPSIRKGVK